MSYGDKVTYGGSPPKLDANCIDNKEYLADNINELWQQVFIMGGGYVPSAADVDTVPESTPPRRLVRFKTTEAMGATTSNQAAAIAVDGARADIASPAITVYDTLQNYGSAGSGKYGWAMATEYPEGTFRYEIVSLGGEGTVTGTSDDELVKVSSDDSAAQYLIDAQENTGTYNASNHQLVYAQEVAGTPESIRYFTSKVSTTETNTVKASGNDGTPNTLQDKIDSNFRETEDFSNATYEVGTDVTGDQRVYFHVTTATEGNGGTFGEQVQLYLKRSEDTGTVKTNKNDTLDYLENQFKDVDTYDSTKHQLIYSDDTGTPRTDIRLYTETALCAKITTTISERTNDQYGVGTAAIGYVSSGAWTSITSSVNVYNPSASKVVVPSSLASIHIPVVKVNDEWVLVNPFDPHQLIDYADGVNQSIGHDAGDVPEWQNDGACD